MQILQNSSIDDSSLKSLKIKGLNSFDDIVRFGSGVESIKSALETVKSNDYANNGKVIFISDENIWQNCKDFFPQDFLDQFAEVLLLKAPKADEESLEQILKTAQDCDFIFGFGSGTINDLCKYSSFKLAIPYAILASAPSMNGYLSKNASITISGHKKTLAAILPKMVFCDLKILKAAPLELIKAGIGDSLCFYSCWFDWYLSHKILGTEFDQIPFDILENRMSFLVNNFAKFSISDDEFLKLLLEILLLSGLGMTIAGGSYPASQSEHLIAHTIDMKFPETSKNLLHGQMIAVTSLTAAKLQKSLLQQISSFSKLQSNFKDDEIIDTIGFFGKKIAVECEKEYEEKSYIIEKSEGNLSKQDWKNLKLELQKIHFSEEKLQEIFDHFEVETSAKSLGISDEEYDLCVSHSKLIRNRFTCLDLSK